MTKLRRTARFTALTIVSCVGMAIASASSHAEATSEADANALRQALSKYQDYQAAVRDLYLSTVGCVYYEGEMTPGYMHYPKGAMGVHFVNLTVRGGPDPMHPNVLIYEPTAEGLRLVAAEWLVPFTPGSKRPTLFGQEFQGPMEGHYPLIPKEFIHYDLHAWLFKPNPNGMFSPTNPDVTCDKSDFPLLEKATKMVPEQ